MTIKSLTADWFVRLWKLETKGFKNKNKNMILLTKNERVCKSFSKTKTNITPIKDFSKTDKKSECMHDNS